MASLKTLGHLADHLRGLATSAGTPTSSCTVSVAPRDNDAMASGVAHTQVFKRLPYEQLPGVVEEEDAGFATPRLPSSRDFSWGANEPVSRRRLEQSPASPPRHGQEHLQGASSRDGFLRLSPAGLSAGPLNSPGAAARSFNQERLTPRLDSARNLSSSGLLAAKMLSSKSTLTRHVLEKWRPHKLKEMVDGPATKGVTRRINGEDVVGCEFDIPEDTYGASILAIVKELQEIYHSVEIDNTVPYLSVIRCVFALLLLFVNLVMQSCLLYYMRRQVVNPAVHHVQTRYREFHQQAYDADGKFRHDFWEQYDGKDELCQIAMTNMPFYVAILFVWTSAILFEFRTTESLFRDVYRMPVCEQGGLMMLHEAHIGQMSIVALTQQARLMLFLLVCVPKLLISVALLFLGYAWLSATTSFEDLVMNTVSMEFVLRIDELFYSTFLPIAYRKKVADINFFIREDDHEATEEEEQSTEWSNYIISLVYLFVGVCSVILYAFQMQMVMPHNIEDVQYHCRHFIHSLQPICEAGESNCYPFGMASSRRLRGVVRTPLP